MALSIRNPEVERLARELSGSNGTSMTATIHRALLLLSEQRERNVTRRAERMLSIGRLCAAVPDQTDQTMDEIIGYGETGAF